MEKLPLTLAIGDYEHTRDLATGQVPVQGVDLNVLHLPPEEAFFRFSFFREWEVSEMSMGKYVSLRSQEDNSIAAIPVFPSRVFRQSMIYVRDGGKIDRPEQLKGKRIGVPILAYRRRRQSSRMATARTGAAVVFTHLIGNRLSLNPCGGS